MAGPNPRRPWARGDFLLAGRVAALEAGSGLGTTYYVSAGTGSDSNAGTAAAPFATIGKAIVAMVSGDATVVGFGVYTETGLDLGTGGTIDGMTVVFDPGASLLSLPPAPVLTVSADNCDIIDLRIPQDGQVGLCITGSWNRVYGAQIGPTASTAFDVAGMGNQLWDCYTGFSTVSGFDITGIGNKLNRCNSIGSGASRGYYLSGGDRTQLVDCTSTSNETAGYEIANGVDNCLIRGCVSGGEDGKPVDGGEWNDWSNFSASLPVEHHEHTWPVPDWEGGVAAPIAVTTDAADETNGPASTQWYPGEPVALIAQSAIAAGWKWIGLNFFLNTANKIFRWQAWSACPRYTSAKNGGLAWDEGENVLTVADGTLFERFDLVWIYSTYKPAGEILRVTIVAGNVITTERETSQFGAPNTGLRWDHTANAPGTETLTLIQRDDPRFHPIANDLSAPSAKNTVTERWHEPRGMRANCGLILRVLNATDNTNGGGFDVTPILED
jgi:hypothetical protein